MRSTLLLGLMAAVLLACQPEPPATLELSAPVLATPAVKYAWVQYAEKGSASVRAILEGASVECPLISVDAAPAAKMNPRTVPDSYVGFNEISICEFAIGGLAQTVTIASASNTISLPAVTRQTDQITVVGDTGCRLEGGSRQWCEGGSLDDGVWGFPQLSLAAASGPEADLILHVGDYLYRESTQPDSGTCDPFRPDRGWVHCGDYWKAWEADFFAPAQGTAGAGLLANAPWIFVRGNHETCGRSWQGYFLFFYAGSAPESCQQHQDVIDPYLVQLDGLDVYVVDTSNESVISAQSSFSAVYNMLAFSTQSSWLVTHVPTSDLVPAFANSQLVLRENLKWIHVGHVHYFHHLPATSAQQAETITGGSGTKLDACNGITICAVGGSDNCCYGELSHSDAGEYSYLTVALDRQHDVWRATLRDVQGNDIFGFTVP